MYQKNTSDGISAYEKTAEYFDELSDNLYQKACQNKKQTISLYNKEIDMFLAEQDKNEQERLILNKKQQHCSENQNDEEIIINYFIIKKNEFVKITTTLKKFLKQNAEININFWHDNSWSDLVLENLESMNEINNMILILNTPQNNIKKILKKNLIENSDWKLIFLEPIKRLSKNHRYANLSNLKRKISSVRLEEDKFWYQEKIKIVKNKSKKELKKIFNEFFYNLMNSFKDANIGKKMKNGITESTLTSPEKNSFIRKSHWLISNLEELNFTDKEIFWNLYYSKDKMTNYAINIFKEKRDKEDFLDSITRIIKFTKQENNYNKKFEEIYEKNENFNFPYKNDIKDTEGISYSLNQKHRLFSTSSSNLKEISCKEKKDLLRSSKKKGSEINETTFSSLCSVDTDKKHFIPTFSESSSPKKQEMEKMCSIDLELDKKYKLALINHFLDEYHFPSRLKNLVIDFINESLTGEVNYYFII